MRTRKEIEEETKARWKLLRDTNSPNPYQVFNDPILEVLLDIRDLLVKKRK